MTQDRDPLVAKAYIATKTPIKLHLVLLTKCLKVESYQLAASVPEDLRHEVAGVYTGTTWVDAAHLPFVVAGEENRT